MSPYRDPGPAAPAVRRAPRRTLRGRWRSLRRLLLVWWLGSASARFPAKCPECGRLSWDPEAVRREDYSGRFRHFPRDAANYYRCGHRGGLAGYVGWG